MGNQENLKAKLAMAIAQVNRKPITVSKDTYLLIVAKETSLASPLQKQQQQQQLAKERQFGN
jgi:hypothetical protein